MLSFRNKKLIKIMKGLLSERATYIAKESERFSSDVRALADQAVKIDRNNCATYYRDFFVRNGKFPPQGPWKDECTTDYIHVQWPAAEVSKEIGRIAPHLEFCASYRTEEHGKAEGVVRLKPESVFPK
jgi:hypothetical protein